jgi:hypothetical protein
MLVSTMTDKEVSVEILTDYENNINTYDTESKFCKIYDRERKKKKIRPTSQYLIYYEITSPKNNKWILFVGKSKNKNKYRSIEDISYFSIVYYYTTIGLRAFMVTPSKILIVFNGHLFSRYNERLMLNKTFIMDVAKDFFLNYNHSTFQFIPQNEIRSKVIGLTSGGFIVGEAKLDLEWIICKTFISFGTAGSKLDLVEYEFIKILRYNCQEAKKAKLEDKYRFYRDLIAHSGITESPYYKEEEIVLDPEILNKYSSWLIKSIS